MIEGCDLAGFNSNRFDIPLLAEEMLRANVNFDMENRKAIDVQVIFHKKEQRNLAAGYEFYCGKNLIMPTQQKLIPSLLLKFLRHR